MSETVLDRLIACLEAALDHHSAVGVAPIALLWPDEGRQWEAVIDRVADRLPVITLGDYDPDAHRGPAYWIRCIVARTIKGKGVPFVENNLNWHHKNKVTEDEVKSLLTALEGDR